LPSGHLPYQRINKRTAKKTPKNRENALENSTRTEGSLKPTSTNEANTDTFAPRPLPSTTRKKEARQQFQRKADVGTLPPRIRAHRNRWERISANPCSSVTKSQINPPGLPVLKEPHHSERKDSKKRTTEGPLQREPLAD
jgi:hypothetical protein